MAERRLFFRHGKRERAGQAYMDLAAPTLESAVHRVPARFLLLWILQLGVVAGESFGR